MTGNVALHEKPETLEFTDFRDFVSHCALDAQLVECCNQAYGTVLKAPIEALLSRHWPLEASHEGAVSLGCFVVFVHEYVWQPLCASLYERAAEELT